ncbi:hypothetical protein JW711_00500 [Candidatus Woesearchaeota archaeon]|nr:hypothetical protein [Candidatus Woesearchaeota archaeon]
MAKGLEGHILLELDSWKQGRMYDDKWNEKYSSPYINFSSSVQICVGRKEGLEIHRGNRTEIYFEELRFKPVKLIVAAVPFLNKIKHIKGHCDYVDYFTFDIYRHPNGTLYSKAPLNAYDKNNGEIPVKMPFDYLVRDLLSVPKANALLNRNSNVLKEVNSRIDELEHMRDLILRHGKTG